MWNERPSLYPILPIIPPTHLLIHVHDNTRVYLFWGQFKLSWSRRKLFSFSNPLNFLFFSFFSSATFSVYNKSIFLLAPHIIVKNKSYFLHFFFNCHKLPSETISRWTHREKVNVPITTAFCCATPFFNVLCCNCLPKYNSSSSRSSSII